MAGREFVCQKYMYYGACPHLFDMLCQGWMMVAAIDRPNLS